MARGRGHSTLSGGSFATSRKIPEEVFRTGEPRLVADLLDGDLANVHMGTVALGIRNVLCVPLRLVRYVDKAENVGEERRIGVLYLDSREKGVAALGLDARRARDARHRGGRGHRERASLSRNDGEGADGAGDADRGGDPAGPAAEGARIGSYFRAAAASLPCRSIGGDFYDYVELGNGALGFALGDVAGKGPPAALLSAMMQGIFAAQAATNDEPSQTITRVNLALCRRGIESRFVTLMRGVLDADGQMVYCNAGHNPPLVISSRGGPAARVRGADRRPVRDRDYEEETAACRRRLADHLQRRHVGGDVGLRRGIRRGAHRCASSGTRRPIRPRLLEALFTDARIRAGRAAERRHHRMVLRYGSYAARHRARRCGIGTSGSLAR